MFIYINNAISKDFQKLNKIEAGINYSLSKFIFAINSYRTASCIAPLRKFFKKDGNVVLKIFLG